MPPLDSSAFQRSEPEAQPSPVLAMPSVAMARFRRLMQYEGWDADLTRMCVDRSYAHECLARAHTSNSEALRRASLELFDAYDRNGETDAERGAAASLVAPGSSLMH